MSTGPSLPCREGVARATRRDTRSLVWYFALAGTLLALVVVIYGFSSPAVRRDLSREHGVVETPTAVFFLTASVLGAYRLRKARARWRDVRWIVPAVALVGMLDEVNWIMFPLGVRRPLVLGHRVDGLHDIVEMCVHWLRHEAPWWSTIVVGLVVAAGIACAAGAHWRRWPEVSGSAWWPFFVSALALGIAAQAVDVLASQRNRLATLCEEILELDAAVALVFAAWRLTWAPRAVSRAAPRGGAGDHPE